jgi:hypothetical protein
MTVPENITQSHSSVIRVALHDHVGCELTGTREGLLKVLEIFGKNAVQAICGRAKSGRDVTDRLRMGSSHNKLKRWQLLYRKLFGRKNGNRLEHNFFSFRKLLHQSTDAAEILSVVDVSPIITHCKSIYGETYFIKAQEVHCAGGVELVVLGIKDDYPNGLAPMEIIGDAVEHDGYVILSTPFLNPDRPFFGSAKRVLGGYPYPEIAKSVDAIEVYNQQLGGIPTLNSSAVKLAKTHGKPGIVASDLHLYTTSRLASVHQSAMLLPSEIIASGGTHLIPAVRDAIKNIFQNKSLSKKHSVTVRTIVNNLLQVWHLSSHDRAALFEVPDNLA